MNKLKTIATGAAVSVVTVFGLAGPAVALSSADACYLVVTHVTTTTNTLHDASDKRRSVYLDAADRVIKQIRAAHNAGYDTTQLQADYKALSDDLAQFQTDRQKLEADMTDVQSVSQADCGSGGGQFVDALNIARAQLTVLRADDVKIRVDIRQTLIPDIRNYVTWLRSKVNPGAATN